MRYVPQHTGVWRTHRPLLLLIIFMGVVFLGQKLLALAGMPWAFLFMATPEYVVASWEALLDGHVSFVQIWHFGTLFSCVFLHADLQHLLFNMLFFWMFGAVLLELLGTRWLFILFVVTGVMGSIVHTILNATAPIPVLGASGAVMGFEGAYLALVVRWRLPDPHVWPIAHPISPTRLAVIAIIGIVGDYNGLMNHGETNIAYGAHIGGFIAGLFVAGFLAPRPRLAQPR